MTVTWSSWLEKSGGYGRSSGSPVTSVCDRETRLTTAPPVGARRGLLNVRWPEAPSSGRDDRHQQGGGMARAGMDGHATPIHLGRTGLRVVVGERPHPPTGVDEGPPELVHRPLVLVVLAPHGEGEPVPGWEDDTGGDDLHLHLVDLPRGQGLHLVVGVVGTVGQGAGRIELAVRHPQP